MAIDYGDARTGVAISDPGALIVSERYVIAERQRKRLSLRLLEDARQKKAGLIVIGLPRNMDGSEGPRAEKSREFASLLAAPGAPELVFWDERLSTAGAHRLLKETGAKRLKEKDDALAAALILEGYLNSLRR